MSARGFDPDHCAACGDFLPCGESWLPDVNTSGSVRRVAKPVMIMRSLRVPEKLWEAAKAKADERQENISDVIREALERYVKRK